MANENNCQPNETDWSQPTEMTPLDSAFSEDLISVLIPAMDDIPTEFTYLMSRNKWVEWQTKWFFKGLKIMPETKDGVNQVDAIRHLRAIQTSFEPKHEHKQAAVAYLASLWFKEPTE